MRARRRLAITTITALLLSLLTALPARAEAPTFSLTFSIDYLRQIEDPDSGGLGDGDYFPRVRIADGPLEQGPRIEDDEFSPLGLPEAPNGWTFTKNDLPGTVPTVPITVTLWDWDDGLNTNDDRMDISPVNDDVELNLVYDVRSGTLSGDGLPDAAPCVNSSGTEKGQYCVQGDGDHGFPKDNDGRITRIGISVTTTMPDTDQDGIPDIVELSGIRNAAGTVLVNPTDPCRKTIIVQLDWMADARHSHQPKAQAITLVENAFGASPTPAAAPCPYPGPRQTGIEFVHHPGVQLAEQATLGLGNNMDYRNFRNTNFPRELAPYAHYGIFAHDLIVTDATGSNPAPGVSGQCCEPTRDNNKDFIVTFGSWRTMCVTDFGIDYGGDATLQTTPGGDDVVRNGLEIHTGPNRRCDTTSAHATDRQVLTPGTGTDDAEVGTVQDQAGTIMHELGHALNLRHGGDTNTQWKSNYLSVMNYFFQSGIPNSPPPLLVNQMRDWKIGNVRVGYSPGGLPPLVKGALDENTGIRDGTDWTFWWTDNLANPTSMFRPLRAGAGNGRLNWNDNAVFETGTVPVDINASGATTETLTDHNDWAAIKYRGLTSPDRLGTACSSFPVAAPTCSGSGAELDYTTVARQEISLFNQYDPDVKLTKTVDKADAEPGEDLKYHVKLDNIGTGGAATIKITDTPPTGPVQTRDAASLASGKDTTETFAYTVPCDTVDGSVLTNRATVTAKDTAGGAEANTTNNSDTASTTVHAPKLTLTKTAPATVNAGEAVKVTLKVANTGSGTATDTVLTEALPKEVYYSQALDLGAGPRPTGVARNADGTTTLTWTLGSLTAGATRTVEFTVRPSLLFTAGATLTGSSAAAYKNAKGCVYEPVTASATTAVTEVAPTRDPRSHGYWKTHASERTDELRARVQATDQRSDANADGMLDNAEADAVLSAGGAQPDPLKFQLLATLFDLAARQINASTRIDSPLTRRLGVTTVGGAVRFAFASLKSGQQLPDATTLLDEIVNNRSEVY
ncbi:CARDB domain-containing protein [Nonomuraea sp. NPDC050556]|uniref:CARDB domain-containing protein n=1 Tax=Nonomuraea sp. NPDC050556 TaxID=3364369 RepID=UPI003795885F